MLVLITKNFGKFYKNTIFDIPSDSATELLKSQLSVKPYNEYFASVDRSRAQEIGSSNCKVLNISSTQKTPFSQSFALLDTDKEGL